MNKKQNFVMKQNKNTDNNSVPKLVIGYHFDKNNVKFEEPSFVIVRDMPPKFFELHKTAQTEMDIELAYRTLKVEQMITQSIIKMKTIDETILIEQLKGIRLAIHPQWIHDHLKCLPRLEWNNITHYLYGSMLATLCQHVIVVLDQKCSKEQELVEFYGLCWMGVFANEDDPKVIIVHKNSYMKYMSLHTGILFYKLLIQEDFIQKYTHLFDESSLSVLTNQFGVINIPTQSDLHRFPQKYLYMYPYWSQVLIMGKDVVPH